MSELLHPDHHGDEHRRCGTTAAGQGSNRTPASADAGDLVAEDCRALSGPDRAAHEQARALWAGVLDPGQASFLTETELGRAWTVAQCWRSVDPDAERAVDFAEHQLWERRPDVMQRYDCLTAVGADHIEATLRVAPSLDRPAAPAHRENSQGVRFTGQNSTTIGGDSAVVRGTAPWDLLPRLAAHDLTAPRAVLPSTAVAPVTAASQAASQGALRQA